jgi:hypothetical protein
VRVPDFIASFSIEVPEIEFSTKESLFEHPVRFINVESEIPKNRNFLILVLLMRNDKP